MRIPAVYRSRNFQRLWFSTAVSKAGSNLTEIALAVFAFRAAGGRPEAYAVVLAMNLLPALVLGWAAGGVVDRWNRRRTMVAGDILRAVLIASVPFVDHLWWAYGVVFTSQSIGLLYTPNQRAILPATVEPGQVLRANAAIGAATHLVDIPAYASGVALLLRVGIRPTFLGDGASYLLAGLAVAGLALPRAAVQPAGVGSGPPFGQTLREGFAYHRQNPLIATLLALALAGSAGVEGVNVLVAALVRNQLHRPEAAVGVLFAAMAAGGWAAATVVGRLPERRAWFPWVAGAGLTAVGGACLALAAAHTLTVAVVGSALAGAGTAVVVIPTATWLQSTVPADLRGRVYAARRIVIAVGGTCSVLGAGWLAQHAGVPGGFTVLAAILTTAGVLAIATLRRFAQP